MKTQITHLKILRYKEILDGPVRPIHWDVDPSSVCDHRCRGCPYIFDGPVDPMLGVAREESAVDRRTFLDYGRFSTFLEEAVAHGCKAITFVGGGEPTMHPRFVDMMDETHAAGVKFGVVTHLGRRYPVDFFAALARATWVRVSVNAGTAATYLVHQQRDHFGSAMANMKTAAKLGTRIGMSFLITEDNHTEIVTATLAALDAGARFIQFKPIIELDLGKAYESCSTAIRIELNEAAQLATPDFQVLDQWSGRLEELLRHARGEFKGECHVQKWNPKLGANGIVYHCCELAYSRKAEIGSIYESSLAQILEAAALVPGFSMEKCPHCWDKPANTLINEGRLGEACAPPESIDQEFV